MLVTISLYNGVKYGTLECKRMDSWNKYGDECYLWMQMYLFVVTDVLGGAARIGQSLGQGQPAGGSGRWFPRFSCIMFMFWNNLLMMIFY